MITVVRAGPQLLVQDLGRPGHAAIGLSPSGALDARALRTANRLVGNPDSAAGLELLLGGAVLRFDADAVVAVAGATGKLSVTGPGSTTAKPAAAGRPRKNQPDLYRPFRVRAGQRLEIAPAASGLRYYLAVAGGIAAETLMGSAATDLLSGMGPAPLRDGDVVETGAVPPAGRTGSNPAAALAGRGRGPATHQGAAAESHWTPVPLPPAATVTVRLRPGPRLDWFTADTRQRLVLGHWTLSAESNRIGLRLLGRPLQRAVHRELPSEGMVTGAVQVPPSGLPTIFLADHPVTGGYPVPAVVEAADLPALAQARPGQRLRFLWAG